MLMLLIKEWLHWLMSHSRAEKNLKNNEILNVNLEQNN